MSTEITSETKTSTLIERLFSVGAHFGFSKSRRHPTAAPFIFSTKHGTDIIDLEKTQVALEHASALMHDAGKTGKVVLFVGTKEEIVPCVLRASTEAKMPHVVNRWVGGMLTNFSEVRKRIARLKDLVAQGESGELERKYTKKERVMIGRELDKLKHNFSGIESMERLPHYLVIVDPRHDDIAVKEAQETNIPTIGITGSDMNLRNITYPIVVNDTLQSSVDMVLNELVQAFEQGKKEYKEVEKEDTRKRN